MRVTYDPEADATYIYLTDQEVPPGRDSVPCDLPEDMDPDWVVMDWKEGRLVGIEVLEMTSTSGGIDRLLLRLEQVEQNLIPADSPWDFVLPDQPLAGRPWWFGPNQPYPTRRATGTSALARSPSEK